MNARAIRHEVHRLKAKYKTDDPYEICDAMDITVSKKMMGRHEGSCKGFFINNSRCKTIVINDAQPALIQRIILVHELGHAVLHAGSTKVSAFHDTAVLDNTDCLEYEANVFSAEFLLDDDEVLDLLKSGYSYFEVARNNCVPSELLDFKLQIMRSRGYDLIPPYLARGDYLKRDLGGSDY